MKQRFSAMKRVWRTLAPVCAALVLVAGSLWAGTLDDPALEYGTVSAPRLNSSLSTAKMAAEESYDAAADMGAVQYSMTSGSSASVSRAGGTQLAAQSERKLVRTADLTLRTQQYQEAAQQAQTLLESMGGYVESLYEYGDTTRRLSLYMRVPSAQLDAFLSGVEGIGRVTNRSESTIDMTTQYVDNQARLNTLYAKRERLSELLAQAEEVSDLIEIESAIADTQYQIDSYESSQRSIDQQVELSAVNLTLIEETPTDTANDAELSLGQRIRAAFSASLEWTGGFLRNMLVFIVIVLPVAIPVGLILLAVWLVRRRRANHSKED